VVWGVESGGGGNHPPDALAAHRTQREGIDRLFLKRGDVEELLAVELFRQAFGPPLATRPCDDLFAGLVR
jgi:hypothetical protein